MPVFDPDAPRFEYGTPSPAPKPDRIKVVKLKDVSWPPAIEELRGLAAGRDKTGASSQRVWNKNHDLVGILGEIAFGLRFGLKPDFDIKAKGDDRIDFTVTVDGVDITIDVKSTEHPTVETAMLLREKDKPHADILVLGQVSLASKMVYLLGWEWDSEMLKQATMKFGGQWDKGAENHMKYAPSLKKIELLEEMLGINHEGHFGPYVIGEPYACNLPCPPLCEKLNTPYYDRIKAMSWPEYSADLVRRQRAELQGRET